MDLVDRYKFQDIWRPAVYWIAPDYRIIELRVLIPDKHFCLCKNEYLGLEINIPTGKLFHTMSGVVEAYEKMYVPEDKKETWEKHLAAYKTLNRDYFFGSEEW